MTPRQSVVIIGIWLLRNRYFLQSIDREMGASPSPQAIEEVIEDLSFLRSIENTVLISCVPTKNISCVYASSTVTLLY